MSRFLQLHLLTFFPPANLNRDDTGRPKTAIVGGTTRLRLSSQSLKRAWRKSEIFATALDGHLGDRTRRIGRTVAEMAISETGLSESDAHILGRFAAATFGKIDAAARIEEELFTKQLVFVSPIEGRKLRDFVHRAATDNELISRLRTAADELMLDADDGPANNDRGRTDENSASKKKPKKQSSATKALRAEIRNEILTHYDTAADIALFGRMLADDPAYNREAAAQVAHAITTHRVTVEDDYYTAVDDLKRPSEDAGAGFLGEASFGSGVFYLYLCVDRALLVKNLGGDTALAATALGALVEAAATTAPSGKQNSFAAHGRAHYVLAERGDTQPRTLAGAFSRAVVGEDLVEASIKALAKFRKDLDEAYGISLEHDDMQVGVKGTLAQIVAFAKA